VIGHPAVDSVDLRGSDRLGAGAGFAVRGSERDNGHNGLRSIKRSLATGSTDLSSALASGPART